jgi:hypothetical protein
VKIRASQLERSCRDGIGDLTWVEAHATQIARANDFVDDGRKGTNYDAVRRGDAELTGPEQAAERALTGRGREVDKAVDAFVVAMRDARDAAARARSLASLLLPMGSEHASTLAVEGNRQPGAGHCLNCPRYCSGIGDDRLRASRCDPCRKYRDRNGTERPKELWSEVA